MNCRRRCCQEMVRLRSGSLSPHSGCLGTSSTAVYLGHVSPQNTYWYLTVNGRRKVINSRQPSVRSSPASDLFVESLMGRKSRRLASESGVRWPSIRRSRKVWGLPWYSWISRSSVSVISNCVGWMRSKRRQCPIPARTQSDGNRPALRRRRPHGREGHPVVPVPVSRLGVSKSWESPSPDVCGWVLRRSRRRRHLGPAS